MRFLFYTHSLVSDWNHGNAHFLRGVMRALARRGHPVLALEPADGWSRQNLLADRGPTAVDAFTRAFPDLPWRLHGPGFDHEAALDDADVVLVHEWTDPALVARIGRHRRRGGRFLLFFHDTHHRAVSDRQGLAGTDLEDYDGVLAFGASLRDRYEKAGWGRSVHVWHEAADITVFHPRPAIAPRRDLIWIGNWGDGERAEELETFLIAPVARLGLRATLHGVRYPDHALARVRAAGFAHGGSLANTDVPTAFARHRVTIHVPRGPYVAALPGIPTIRPFEALACGIPLVSAPWSDREGLFRPGDIRFARNGREMVAHLRAVLDDPAAAAEQARQGLETIRARHTCDHRADELLDLIARARGAAPSAQGIPA